MTTIHELRAAEGLVDVHCHVLPGLDDGAVTLADSLAMAAQAQADGISVICATPHIRHDHDVLTHELPERVVALNQALLEAGIEVLVVPGGELAEPRSSELTSEELQAVTLGGSGGWVLLEPRPGPMDHHLEEAVDALHARGVRCLIAHPERHAGGDAADRLHALVARGALIQVTAALLVGHPAAPTMLDWAAQGLVHVLGSDSHSAHIGRPVALTAGLAELAKLPHLAPHLDWIAHEAPRAMLAGLPLTPPF